MSLSERLPSVIWVKLLSFYEQINGSIYNRVNFAMISLVLSVLLMAGTLSFGFMSHLVGQNIRKTLEADADQAVMRFDNTMNSICESMSILSKNLLVTNALIDTIGRDAYIAPFLKSYELEPDLPVKLTLCDFMGAPIASNTRTPGPFNSPELLKKTIEEGGRFAELRKDGDDKSLLIAIPVILVVTNKAEGIIVAELSLNDLFNKVLPYSGFNSGRSVSLLSGGDTLLERNERTGPVSLRLKKPLFLYPPLDEMAFHLEIRDYRETGLDWLIGIYLLVGIFFTVLTLWVSKSISSKLTNRLTVLSDAAKRIEKSGSLDLSVEVKGSDEVAALASAFKAMIDKVAEARDTLERRVEERTELLFRANEGLMEEVRERKMVEAVLKEYKENLEELVRKRTEELSVLNEHLQRVEKMEALGVLAGGVAHDLNNVLGIVVGYSELLIDDVSESSQLRPAILMILEAAQKAAAIVQDLLTMARRGVSSRKVVNLNDIIVNFLKSPEYKKLSSYHPTVKVVTDFEPDPLNISGSPVHLGKSLFNLIANASEAMPNGGALTIRTAGQYLDKPVGDYDEISEGDYALLSVSDTGEGISPDDLKHIFEPFYTKKVMGRSGTGLGLAVVWGTVKDHDGYIVVRSREGEGSTFTLYFPLTRDEISREKAPASLAEYLGRGESILVVDDVESQRELAGKMLAKLNYNVVSIPSGEEAIEYLMQNEADLVLLDMIMDPGMDGLDTYKKILEIHPRQKAIIVSGFSETERVAKAQQSGAGAYVRKPYVLEKLGLAIRKELDRGS